MLAKSRSIDSTGKVNGTREMSFQAGNLVSGVVIKVIIPHPHPYIHMPRSLPSFISLFKYPFFNEAYSDQST